MSEIQYSVNNNVYSRNSDETQKIAQRLIIKIY